MSRTISTRRWGPSHQEIEPRFRRGPSLPWKIAGLLALALLLHGLLDPRSNFFAWSLEAVAVVWLARLALIALVDGRIARLWSLIVRRAPVAELVGEGGKAQTPGEAARAEVARLGGGAYLGVGRGGAAAGPLPIPRAR